MRSANRALDQILDMGHTERVAARNQGARHMLTLVEALQKSTIKGSVFLYFEWEIEIMQLALPPHLHANRAVGPQRSFIHSLIGNDDGTFASQPCALRGCATQIQIRFNSS